MHRAKFLELIHYRFCCSIQLNKAVEIVRYQCRRAYVATLTSVEPLSRFSYILMSSEFVTKNRKFHCDLSLHRNVSVCVCVCGCVCVR